MMDCNMPGMNGYEACTYLKDAIKQGKLKEMYIIAYTADITETNIEKCYKYQFDKVYNKPCKKEELKALLEKVFT